MKNLYKYSTILFSLLDIYHIGYFISIIKENPQGFWFFSLAFFAPVILILSMLTICTFLMWKREIKIQSGLIVRDKTKAWENFIKVIIIIFIIIGSLYSAQIIAGILYRIS